jgi:hypothetical protein
MSVPDIEETVEQLRIFANSQSWSSLAQDVAALIADWRKRGEALEEARLVIPSTGSHSPEIPQDTGPKRP